jgi:hypothetical protein
MAIVVWCAPLNGLGFRRHQGYIKSLKVFIELSNIVLSDKN